MPGMFAVRGVGEWNDFIADEIAENRLVRRSRSRLSARPADLCVSGSH